MVWTIDINGFRKHYNEVSMIELVLQCERTAWLWNPYQFNFASLHKAFQVRESKVLTERLYENSSITTDMFLSNEFARGDIEIHCQFVDGEIGWQI